MAKTKFTKEQIKKLLSNRYVIKCSEKNIAFSNAFKLKAVKQYDKGGLTPSEIFRLAGFDLDLIDKSRRSDCLRRWLKKYRSKGATGLRADNRGRSKKGGRPKTKNLTEAEKIKWLEAKVAYLKAENDFLAKLRAKRTE